MKTSKKYILGFIGCGHMGLAIARGCVQAEYLDRWQIVIHEHKLENRNLCKGERFSLADSEQEVVENAHIVVLAVRPDQAEEVLKKIAPYNPDCLLSIVTGLSIQHIQEIVGKDVPVIRAMPNTPLQIKEGSTALCMSSNCKADDYDFIFQMFQEMGIARTIPENKMNAIVAVHGSVPAYVYYFIECILKDAVDRGIDEDSARALLVQTVIGSGMLLAKNQDKSISEFVDEVASKGGTTIEAIKELKKQNLARILHEANEKCVKRAEELGK